jgi:dCMP deaminase
VIRPSWDDVWGDVADSVRWRSLCSKARAGAVIADAHNRIVSTGYNGPPADFDHSDLPCRHWCPRGAAGEELDRCVSVHAEANALLSADRSSWTGGTMYTTKHPCLECAKLIANSGLSRLVVTAAAGVQEERHTQVYRFLQEDCGLVVEVLRTADVTHIGPVNTMGNLVYTQEVQGE